MRSRLEGPDAVVRPPTKNPALRALQVLSGQLIDVIQDQAVPDIEDGIAAIQAGVGIARGVALAGGGSVGAGSTAVPSGAVVN